jgi:hypothetical protein
MLMVLYFFHIQFTYKDYNDLQKWQNDIFLNKLK